MNALRLLKIGASREEKNEHALIKAAQEGNRSAFDVLAHTYAPLLHGFLLRRVGTSAVDDVLQETLLAGWTSLPGYTRRARFKSWLFAIAAHKCADYYRLRGKTARETPLREAEWVADSRRDSYAAVDWKQTIQSVLELLPPEQREVLELYYYADLSLPEVARALERNLNTVKYQFYRAHTLVEQEMTRATTSVGRLWESSAKERCLAADDV